MRTIVIDDPSVCQLVCHAAPLCKNGWTDQRPGDLENIVLNVGPPLGTKGPPSRHPYGEGRGFNAAVAKLLWPQSFTANTENQHGFVRIGIDDTIAYC